MYIRLWQFLRRDLPFDIFDWANLQIVTDFETAMRNAVRRILPECRLIGCWFHFSQVCILYSVKLNFYYCVVLYFKLINLLDYRV